MAVASNAKEPKYRRMLSEIKRRIAEGAYPPGSQLPTRADFEREFNTSHMTMQRVLNQLDAEGFTDGRPTRGTYVADHPPPLTCYAVGFYHEPDQDHPDSRYEAAILSVLQRWQTHSAFRYRAYFGLGKHTDVEDLHRLVADFRQRRLAGMIMPFPLHGLHDAGVFELPGAYHATITAARRAAGRGQARASDRRTVGLDFDAFADRAMQTLAQHGRRRVGTLLLAHPDNNPGRNPGRDGVLADAAERHGLASSTVHRLFAHEQMPLSIDRCVETIMQGDAKSRPDALVVADDNLVDQALSTLIRLGLRIPDDVEVVAYANFPAGPRPIVPITRIGFDMADALRQCVGMIEKQRRGEAFEPCWIAPIDESRYAPVEPLEMENVS